MRTLTTALVLGTLAAFGLQPAHSQTETPQAQYQLDLLRCEQERSVVDIDACKKEAAAALQAARTDDLGNSSATNYQANERARCMALPENQRQDCLLLLTGQNTRIKGSVDEGGVLRETTIIIPAPPPVSAPSIAQPPARDNRNIAPEAAIPSPVSP